ncbi:hypothetical protein BPO_1614 [Bergeyella porcorum]|uniref:Uncharacterized protein n=1 Tax=Bergeyella porcorum TaxID=1735111 RepID=A0AAU0F2K4_9FLAO
MSHLSWFSQKSTYLRDSIILIIKDVRLITAPHCSEFDTTKNLVSIAISFLYKKDRSPFIYLDEQRYQWIEPAPYQYDENK